VIRRCKHEQVRCIHGDEIIHSRWRRIRCLDCGRALKGMERFHEDGCNYWEHVNPDLYRFIKTYSATDERGEA